MLRDFGPMKNSLIYSGTRGPDIDQFSTPDYCRHALYRLKISITGRLRVLCYGEKEASHFGAFLTEPMTEREYRKIVEDIFTLRESANRLEPFATWHYIVHLREAIMAIQDEDIWGGFGEKLIEILRV